jgi:predicted transcriptional regulator
VLLRFAEGKPLENNAGVKRRRDRLEVINEILDVAVNGVVKTKIMYRVNVNFRQFECYVDSLLEADLIEVVEADSRKIYKTTEKGKTLLEKLRETSWIFNEIQGEDALGAPIIKRGESAYIIRR